VSPLGRLRTKDQAAGPRLVVAAMTVLQIGWLAAIVLTGASPFTARIALAGLMALAAAAAALMAPAAWLDRGAVVGRWFAARDRRMLALITAVVVVAGGIYVFHTNLSFSDEGQIAAIAQLISDEGFGSFFRRFSTLPWLGDRHPPLMPLLYGLVARLVGDHLVVLRLTDLLLFALPAALLCWRLAIRLVGRRAAALAWPVFVAMPYFLRLGAVAMLDMALVTWFTLALLMMVWLEERPRLGLGLRIGLVAGVGLLTKYHMALLAPALAAWLIVRRPGAAVWRALGVASVVGLAIVAAWFAVASQLGASSVQTAQVLRHVTFVSRTILGLQFALETVVTRLPSGLGAFTLPLLAVGVWHLWRQGGMASRTVLGVVGAVWLPLLVTVPDPRYFAPTFPLLAAAAGAWLASVDVRWRVRLLAVTVLNAVATWGVFWDWQRQALLVL